MNRFDDTTLRAALEAAEQPPAHAVGYRERLHARLHHEATQARQAAARDAHRAWFARRHVLIAVAATAAVTAVIAVVTLVGRTAVREAMAPPSAEAAEVVAKARLSLASFETLRAKLVWGTALVDWPSEDGKLTGDELTDRLSVVMPLDLRPPCTVVITADGRWSWFSDPSGKVVQAEQTSKEDGTTTSVYVKPDFWTPRTRIEETADWSQGTYRLYQPSYHWTNPDDGSSESAEYTAWDNVGFAPGPPDTFLEWRGPCFMPLAAWSALEKGVVADTSFEGRPTLTVTAKVTPLVVPTKGDDSATGLLLADTVELTADAATGFPLRTVLYLKDEAIEYYELRDLELDGKVSPRDFTLTFPEDIIAERTDWGFHNVTVAKAARALGYTPFELDRPPKGFSLERTAAARRTELYSQRLTEDGLETATVVCRDVLSLGYRRGFLHVTVTTRPTDGVDPIWVENPFTFMALNAGSMEEPEAVELTDGAFAGATAHLVLPPLGTPALWVEKDGLLVTVAGDLSRTQLVRAAESLAPVE